MSEQCLVIECFFNLFLEYNKLEQLEFKLEKNFWDLETCRKKFEKPILRSHFNTYVSTISLFNFRLHEK